jgi:hypothetical protein
VTSRYLEGCGRWGVRCCVCRRFIGRDTGEIGVDITHGTEQSTIVCAHCVWRITAMAEAMPKDDEPACC